MCIRDSYKSYRKETKNAIPLHAYDAWQATQSIYTQQSMYLTNTTTLGTGLRLQRNHIAIGDNLDTNAPNYAGWQEEHATFSDQETNYAVNIGLDHTVNKKTIIYGRLGNGFRYPNIDDRIGGSGGTSLELKTQTTKDFEIGSKFAFGNFSSNVSTYIIEGKNELAYDTDAFENINMNNGKAVPKAYPITAPIPPHVAAEAGPNNIQAPNADAIKLVDNDNVPTFLPAVK